MFSIIKYFGLKVTSQNMKKVRLYTTILCMTLENITLREEILNYYDQIIEGKTDNLQNISTPNKRTSSLPLIIKEYKGKTLSSYIANTTNPNFIVRGPYVFQNF